MNSRNKMVMIMWSALSYRKFDIWEKNLSINFVCVWAHGMTIIFKISTSWMPFAFSSSEGVLVVTISGRLLHNTKADNQNGDRFKGVYWPTIMQGGGSRHGGSRLVAGWFLEMRLGGNQGAWRSRRNKVRSARQWGIKLSATLCSQKQSSN